MSKKDIILNMKPKDFAKLVETSTSYTNLLHNLGFTNGRFKYLIENRIQKEHINISHFNIQQRGKIWNKSKEEFADIVSKAKSYHGILKYYVETNGGFFGTVKNRIKIEKLDISHFDPHWYNKQKCHQKGGKTKLEEILVENSTLTKGYILKKKLLKAELKEDICEICGLGNKWNGKPITLQLDHINGNHSDNRITNLRILCPNCHSQTDTFCGGNKNTKNRCLDCDKKIGKSSKRCRNCYTKYRKTEEKGTD